MSLAVPPSFTVGLVDVVVFEGDPLRLECQAVGAPPPHYTWYRGNIVLDEIDRYDTSTPGMLKTTDVGRNEAGTYNCSVFSVDNGVMVGSNSTVARVFIVRKSVCMYYRPCFYYMCIVSDCVKIVEGMNNGKNLTHLM